MYKSLTFTTDVHHAAGGTLFIEVFFCVFGIKCGVKFVSVALVRQ